MSRKKNVGVQNKEGDSVYIGAEETLAFVKRVLADEGPFDGVWAFSQVRAISKTLDFQTGPRLGSVLRI